MRKLLIILFSFVFVFTSYAYNNNLLDNILDTKQQMGSLLNDTVNILKKEVKKTEDKIYNQEEDVNTLHEVALELRRNSGAKEVDATLLKHGRSEIKECGSDEELYWNDGWRCKKLDAVLDCDISKGEIKEKVGSDYICKYENKEFKSIYYGWTPCHDSTNMKNVGERVSQYKCYMSVGSGKDRFKLLVDNKYCSDIKNKMYEQACGKYGKKSSCSCKKYGGKYYYDGNSLKKGVCLISPICDNGLSFKDGRCRATLAHFHDSAKRAGGSESVKVKINSIDNQLKVKVWSEDLEYFIKYISDEGKVLFNKRRPSGKDGDDSIDYRTFIINVASPGTLHVTVREGGSASSKHLGYDIQYASLGDIDCGSSGAVFNSKLQTCVIDAPVCNYK